MIHTYPEGFSCQLPDSFTDPFRYSPHPLVIKASELLMARIRNSSELSEIFTEGKMLGVLAVSHGNEVGYLAAFSGNAGGMNMIDGFVPPIFDLLDPKGYFKMKEAEISALNAEIASEENGSELVRLREELKAAEKSMAADLSRQKARMATLKAERDQIRSEVLEDARSSELIRQSQHEKAELRRMKARWEELVGDLKVQIDKHESKINGMKSRRKDMSDALQEWIFRQYIVNNSLGESRSILDIFTDSGLVPPGGTGECAAPKLLDYAFRNGLKPLAMGEFWYGESPSTAVRTEGHFYPSCTSKCGPLLGYMLQGMESMKLEDIHGTPSVLYVDEDIIAVSKPSGMPSVPGLNCGPSLLDWVMAETGCSTVESVHRLDMDTSGVMIFAKNPAAGNHIRKQFEEHTVRKTYRALLSTDGTRPVIKGESGTISIPLSPDYDERPRQKVDTKQGKEAVTEYHVDEVLEDGILITFRPLTGRTHQLRVHSAYHLGLGHPIIGDLLYGGPSASRLGLHAESITFIHPRSGKETTIHQRLTL